MRTRFNADGWCLYEFIYMFRAYSLVHNLPFTLTVKTRQNNKTPRKEIIGVRS